MGDVEVREVDTTDVPSLEAWIVQRLSDWTGASAASIDVERPFEHYGFDSLLALNLVGELEELVGLALPDDLLLRCRTVAEVAAWIAAQKRAGLTH